MLTPPQVSPIVWHDLLTKAVATAQHFYAELLSWDYQTEHAANFVWRPGKADYPLILADGMAHGGFVEAESNTQSRWLAYVRVADVDAVTARASSLGATIERAPFDIPGVGRSAVIRDRQGAVICPTVVTHKFPSPSGTFLRDELNTTEMEAAALFYSQLFGWQMRNAEGISPPQLVINSGSTTSESVRMVARSLPKTSSAIWIPYFGTRNLNATISKAQRLGASLILGPVGQQNTTEFALLTDPTGAMFGLLFKA